MRLCSSVGTLVLGLLLSAHVQAREAQTLDRSTRDTLTAVEMNHGDTLRFRLKTDELRTFVLEHTRAWVVERCPWTVYALMPTAC
jgi:hypothetical protein